MKKSELKNIIRNIIIQEQITADGGQVLPNCVSNSEFLFSTVMMNIDGVYNFDSLQSGCQQAAGNPMINDFTQTCCSEILSIDYDYSGPGSPEGDASATATFNIPGAIPTQDPVGAVYASPSDDADPNDIWWNSMNSAQKQKIVDLVDKNKQGIRKKRR